MRVKRVFLIILLSSLILGVMPTLVRAQDIPVDPDPGLPGEGLGTGTETHHSNPVTFVETLTYEINPTEGTFFLPPNTNPRISPYYRWYNEDWDWTHTFIPDCGPGNNCALVSVTLDIRVYDQDPSEVDNIYVDGTFVGPIAAGLNNAWTVTSFDLLNALGPTMFDTDFDLVVWMDIDVEPPYPNWAITIDWSKLTVEYACYSGAPLFSNLLYVLPLGIVAGTLGIRKRRKTKN